MATKILKAYDELGYETMRLEVQPPSPFIHELEDFIKATDSFGMSAYEAGCAIGGLNNTENQILSLTSRFDVNIASLNDRLVQLEKDIRALKETIDLLRPVASEKTEIPNQKDDYLFLGEIGWSADILDLNASNIFLS